MKGRFLTAVAAYVIPTFLLGYGWHLVTFAEQYERLEAYREDLLIPLGFGSMAIQAVLFAWLYPRLFSTRREGWVGSATRFGVVFGLLAWSFAVLPVAAKYRMASVSDFVLLETAFTILHFAIVSPLIALVYRGATGQADERTPRQAVQAGAPSPAGAA